MKIFLRSLLFIFLLLISNSLFSQISLPTFQATHNNSAVVVPPEDPNDLICSNISIYSSPLCSYSTGCSSPSSALTNGSTTFNHTAAVQTFTVGGGVTSIKIQTWGAQGYNSQAGFDGKGTGGGKGGYAEGILTVTPGQVLKVYVGGKGDCSGHCNNNSPGGFNGGGTGATYGGPGGGGSDVRIGAYGLNDRIIVGNIL